MNEIFNNCRVPYNFIIDIIAKAENNFFFHTVRRSLLTAFGIGYGISYSLSQRRLFIADTVGDV